MNESVSVTVHAPHRVAFAFLAIALGNSASILAADSRLVPVRGTNDYRTLTRIRTKLTRDSSPRCAGSLTFRAVVLLATEYSFRGISSTLTATLTTGCYRPQAVSAEPSI